MGIPILPAISMTCIAISAILIATGWRLIWEREIDKHKNAMLAAAAFALTFFLIYASRATFIGNTAFGEPALAKKYYTIFLFFRINLATVGGILGLVQTVTAFKNKYNVRCKLGSFASVIWFCIATTGVAVHLLLCVLYPGGEMISLIKATFGH